MRERDLYSVGEASKLCKVSKKALRFYDEIGIISPDETGKNDYRYYSKDTLMAIPVIKYYKQMGFKLGEMRDFINGGSTYAQIQHSFKSKIVELDRERLKLEEQYTSVSDWLDLVIEASVIIASQATGVSVKYFDMTEYLFFEQPYNANHKDAIINIEFTNYVDSLSNAITGPVIRQFDSFREKIRGVCSTQRILQKTVFPCAPAQTKRFGGNIMLSCYHIGTHERINETYGKMLRWSENHGYICGESAAERYVIDYWTTDDVSRHVTEIIIDISKAP
ncbi:MAG: MerR family transcriptional regulator [Clostridiales Family XIII bacterium]|jgi:DNA-binding transcriptional MerR regulator|nr:MerR family transcriptional regulator [Clostridiales Family XIII bacterium]